MGTEGVLRGHWGVLGSTRARTHTQGHTQKHTRTHARMCVCARMCLCARAGRERMCARVCLCPRVSESVRVHNYARGAVPACVRGCAAASMRTCGVHACFSCGFVRACRSVHESVHACVRVRVRACFAGPSAKHLRACVCACVRAHMCGTPVRVRRGAVRALPSHGGL